MFYSDLWTRQTNEFRLKVCGQAIEIEIKIRRDVIDTDIAIETAMIDQSPQLKYKSYNYNIKNVWNKWKCKFVICMVFIALAMCRVLQGTYKQ